VNSTAADPVTSTDESERRRRAMRQMEQMGASVVSCGGPVEEMSTDLLETVVKLLSQPREDQVAGSSGAVAKWDEAERRPYAHPQAARRDGWWRRFCGRTS
jgi:hypothetical protein